MLDPQSSNLPVAPNAADIMDSFAADDAAADAGKEEPKVEKAVKADKADKEEKISEAEAEVELSDPEDETEKLDLKDNKEEDEKSATTEDEIEIDAPPRKKEILAKFPEIFKEFPFLEKMLYRDKEYTALFGSFDDAKELAERAEIFTSFERQLLDGKTDDVLKNVKATDQKAFDKIVDDYLPALARVDKDAYFEVVGNIGKKLIMEMFKEGESSSNEDLQNAALLVNQYLFGSSKFTPAKPRVVEEEVKDNKIEQERLSFLQERFDTSRSDLQTRVDNIIKATISDYIDPRSSMSTYVKKNAIADALNNLHELMGSDKNVRINLDKLWRAAFDGKFSKDSLAKIQSFYLGKAKAVLPSAIKKARAEALKDSSPRRENRNTGEDDEKEATHRRGMTTGRPSQPRTKTEMIKGESVLDYLSRD